MDRITGRNAPTLADRFAAGDGGASRRLLKKGAPERAQRRVRDARRFVLDDRAIERFAKVTRDIPDLIAKNLEFAHAPYDITWVEFEFPRFYEMVTGTRGDENCDSHVGYLYDHGTVSVVTGGTVTQPSLVPSLSPFVYDLHVEWSFEEQLAFAQSMGTSRGQIDAFMWGGAFATIAEENHRALRDHVRIRSLLIDRIADQTSAIWDLMETSSGEVRNIVTLLLLLNRPSLTRYVMDVPSTRGWIRNKVRPFMAHTVVTIPLDPEPTLRLVGTSDDAGVTKRRHEVRGHYCHNAEGRGQRCEHVWIADDTAVDTGREGRRWRCNVPGCGGKRWWRDAHARGDASKGFVVKDYNITG